nr:hypothetical protein [Sphingomonas sp. Y57]
MITGDRLRHRLRELAVEYRRFGHSCCRYIARRTCGSATAACSRHADTDGAVDSPDQRWSLDFVSDTLTCSHRFRILCMIDYYTECLALVADMSRELTWLIGMCGKPHTVVSDNDTDTSSAILRWL